MQKLPKTGEAVCLWIETNVREDHIHLYGFLTEEEKNFFNLLTSVQGLGLKGGQALLSVFQPEELALAIAAADTKQITRAPGIGPKLAARIVTELKGKTDMFASSASLSRFQEQSASSRTAEEAISAATRDGYAALGFDGGTLAKGKYADLVLIDLHAPNMRPLSDVRKNLVYSADNANVLLTVCGGKIVYERGKYCIGESLDKIYSECERRRDRLMRQAGF